MIQIEDPEATIVALASGAGPAALGIVRISGANALGIAARLTQNPMIEQINKRSLLVGMIYDGDAVLDQVVISIFKSPASYTGQDLVEISCHGSDYILERVIVLCLEAGTRLAQAGEFTRRAFLSGKLDLAQAEAVADLIACENSQAHKVAMNQMRGGFSLELKDLRKKLIDFAALLELELDFGEEDVMFANRDALCGLVIESRSRIAALLASFAYGNVLKNGVPIAIIGAPNAGKSTLLNALTNEQRAIVSEKPGTTRDTIEEQIQINGLKFRFVDTAGLRDTDDDIEQEGIRRSIAKAHQAHTVIYLVDCLKTTLQTAADGLEMPDIDLSKIVVVLNKQDGLSVEKQNAWQSQFPEWIGISAKNQTGLETLKQRLSDRITQTHSGQGTILTNVRHVESLKHILDALDQIRAGLDTELPTDLLAFHARQALYYLGQITGEISSDDLLDSIFFNFCIGK